MLFSGVHPAVLTPLGAERELRADALADPILWLETLAVFRSLSTVKRQAVVTTVLESASGRVPVTIGIAAETAVLARQATDAGTQAPMCLPPLMYHAADHEIVAFFSEVAASSHLPLMTYNSPAGSRNDLSSKAIGRLFELEAVVAVKECSGDARRIPVILGLTGGEMQVLVGGATGPSRAPVPARSAGFRAWATSPRSSASRCGGHLRLGTSRRPTASTSECCPSRGSTCIPSWCSPSRRPRTASAASAGPRVLPGSPFPPMTSACSTRRWRPFARPLSSEDLGSS